MIETILWPFDSALILWIIDIFVMLHICKKFRQQIDNLSIQLLLLILNRRSFSPMQRLLAPLKVRRRQFVSIISSFFGFRFVGFATRLFLLLCVPVEVECHFGTNELGGVTLVLWFFVNIPLFHLGCQINIFFASISDKYSIFGLKFWASFVVRETKIFHFHLRAPWLDLRYFVQCTRKF